MLVPPVSGAVVVSASECHQAVVVPARDMGFEMWSAYLFRRDTLGTWILVAKSGHWSYDYATRWARRGVASMLDLTKERSA